MLLLFVSISVRSSSGKCLVDNKQIKRKEVNASLLFLRFDLVTSLYNLKLERTEKNLH